MIEPILFNIKHKPIQIKYAHHQNKAGLIVDEIHQRVKILMKQSDFNFRT